MLLVWSYLNAFLLRYVSEMPVSFLSISTAFYSLVLCKVLWTKYYSQKTIYPLPFWTLKRALVRWRSTQKTWILFITVWLALLSYGRTRPNHASDGRAAVKCKLLMACECKKTVELTRMHIALLTRASYTNSLPASYKPLSCNSQTLNIIHPYYPY